MADNKKAAGFDFKEIMPMIDAALAFLETAIPRIKEAFQKGDITVEQQQKMLDRVNALRANPGFTRPEGR